jgi:transcriptional regulator GlxA family with amidase domain
VLDVAGPLHAFHEAASFGLPYEIACVASTPSVPTGQGVSFAGLAPLPEGCGAGDRVVVPGYPVRTVSPPPVLVSWLARAALAGAEVCSICTGAFVLGEAGRLDGRR